MIDVSGFSPKGVFDTMRAWYGGARRYVKLDDIAWVLSISSSKTDSVDGGEVYDLYVAGQLATIRDYNLADVRLTRVVYERHVESTRAVGKGIASIPAVS